MRMYVIEGLGGKGRSMNEFYRLNQRDHQNNSQLKMLYNPTVRYKERLYQQK
jgi:hypothetical protein